ncbi:MAG TPA: hypothetical protein VG796_25315 [Verrucomicrobiales bacterium]|nr:hypothetical protein [Verrucomicrobiales bacterium]
MRLPVLTIFAATVAVVIAGGTNAPTEEAAPAAPPPAAEPQPSEGLPAHSLFAPLAPEPNGPVESTVPEPVWASVLAACAVSLLRRSRS